MAPEQIRGRHDDISPATDVYQLGAILYEILTGHPPHNDRSISSELRGARREAPEVDWAKQARRANPLASPALAAICRRAMSANPKMRYKSVNELRDDIEHWMADEPVSVYRSGPVSSSLRWARHHQKIATLIIASVGLLGTFNAQLLRLAMQEQCNKLAHLLVREMRANVGVIEALEGAFETQEGMSRIAFARTANFYLARHDGIAALEWIPAVRHGERAAYEAAVRASAWPSLDVARTFKFTERSADSGLIRAKPRHLYFPVYYVEPYQGNETAFGYDLGSSSDRLETLRRANFAGGPTISEQIDLVQAEAGLLAASPVTHHADSTTEDPKGYVLGVFKISDLLDAAWEGIDTDHFSVQVYDVTDPNKLQLLWSNAANPEDVRSTTARPGLWGARRELLLWNRTWVVNVRPKLSFLFLYPFALLTAASEPV